MRALKTIVATAVIVFTLTTVAMAMAGVNHFTGQNGQTSQVRAQKAPTTVTLTVRQFQKLLRGQNHARASQNQRQTQRGTQQGQTSRQWSNQSGSGHTYTQGNGSYSQQSGNQSGNRSGYDCYNNDYGHTSGGSGSGYHSGGDGHDGGCW